jgi:hypothetical protein
MEKRVALFLKLKWRKKSGREEKIHSFCRLLIPSILLVGWSGFIEGKFFHSLRPLLD